MYVYIYVLIVDQKLSCLHSQLHIVATKTVHALAAPISGIPGCTLFSFVILPKSSGVCTCINEALLVLSQEKPINKHSTEAKTKD